MLQQMQDFTFKHSEQTDALYTQYTAQQIKALFDSRGDELRTALNLLVDALNSTSGAGSIGTNTIQDVDGTNIQEMLKSVRDKLKSKADGSSGADYVNATPIDGLTGETVQAILEALKSYQDTTKQTLDGKIDSTKTTLESTINTSIAGIKASNVPADPIATGSGNTVQAQLAWLLSQIAVAATGSIPDGSLTEAKLAQALVDKINKALTNTGVLTTLLTNDKSSLVNALNEHLAEDASLTTKGHVQLSSSVTSTSEVLAATSKAVKTAMDRADAAFTQANNGKTDIASVIGSPATSGDTFAQLKTHIQNNKNTLATNLTNKGQSSVGTETLAALVAKVANVNTGKKFATGTGPSSTGRLSIRNLTFRPTIIIFYSGYSMGVTYRSVYYITSSGSTKINHKINNNSSPTSANCVTYDNGFDIDVSVDDTAYTGWIAVE